MKKGVQTRKESGKAASPNAISWPETEDGDLKGNPSDDGTKCLIIQHIIKSPTTHAFTQIFPHRQKKTQGNKIHH